MGCYDKEANVMGMQWNLTDFRDLYQAAPFLSKDNRERLGLLMPVDVYVQDPLVAKSKKEVKLLILLL